MPRETLNLLGEDVDRLLYAGGAAASADAGLCARLASLEALSVKLPKLGQVAEQLRRVLGAEARCAATELLNLSSVVAQLRGAGAVAYVPDAPAEPLRDTPALDTPLTLPEVVGLHKALTQRSGEGRLGLIREALARGRVRDLRLLSCWLDALADGRIGELVATEVLPVLGDVALEPLREAFSMTGGATDARRLKCLAKIEDRRARPLVERALTEGSAAVRAAALEVMAELDPGYATARAMELFGDDRAGEVRAEAVRVVARVVSDAGLDALIAAIGDESEGVGKGAARALERYAHENTTVRLLELLSPEALGIKPLGPRRRRSKLSPAQEKARVRDDQAEEARRKARCDVVLRVISALARRGEACAMAKLRELCVGHPFKAIAEAARRGLCEARDPEGMELLAGFLMNGDRDLRKRAIEAIYAMGPEVAYERFMPCFQPEFFTKDKTGMISEVMEGLMYDEARTNDGRWADRMLGLLAHREVQPWAIDYLTERRDPRALEAFVLLLEAPRCDMATVLDALARLGDRRATAPVAALLERKQAGGGPWFILNALERLDDPLAAPLLRAAALSPRWDAETARQLESLAARLSRE